MKRSILRWCSLVIALFATSAPVRAEFLGWTYSWSTSTPKLPSDHGGGHIAVTPGPGGSGTGTMDIPAVQFEAFGSLDSYTAAQYGLTLSIKDGATGKSGTLNFSGLLTGTPPDLTHGTSGELTKALNLGGNVYTVTLGAFAPPGVPGSGVKGMMEADVIVSQGAIEVPEPASLALAGLGLSALGLRCWTRRRRAG